MMVGGVGASIGDLDSLCMVRFMLPMHCLVLGSSTDFISWNES